jgi:hypothetical protein
MESVTAERREEPVSPELVLVDPELAREARAALEVERPREEPAPPPLVVPSELPAPQPPVAVAPSEPPAPRRRSRVRRDGLRLLLAAVLGGAIVALVLGTQRSGDDRAARTVTTSTTATTAHAAAPTSEPKSRPHRQARRRSTVHKAKPKPKPKPKPVQTPRARHRRTRRARNTVRARPVLTKARLRAERLVLISLPTAPKGKVPPSLLDPKTGLARTNVQATCTAKGSNTLFICLVRRRGAPPGRRLAVGCRLRPNGTAKLHWYGYRRG